MSGVDARLRLSACRWQNEKRDDPFFVEALDEASREPALSAWWREQRALDDVLARRLRELAIPVALNCGPSDESSSS